MKQAILMGGLVMGMTGVGDCAEAKEKQLLLKCELRADGIYKGTPTELVVVYKKGEDRMVVYDNVMKYYERDPVLGRVGRDTDKSFVFRWKLDDLKTTTGEVMDWRFSLNWTKATGRATITGRAAVSDDSNVGTGSCKFIRK